MAQNRLTLTISEGDTIVLDGTSYRVVAIKPDEIQLSVPGSVTDVLKDKTELEGMIAKADTVFIHR